MPKGTPANNAPLTDAEKAAKKAEIQAAKAAKFVELADKRVSKALDAISNIGGLSNKASYVYTAAQAQAIYDALNSQVERTMRSFQPNSSVAKAGFSLAAAVAPATETDQAEGAETGQGDGK